MKHIGQFLAAAIVKRAFPGASFAYGTSSTIQSGAVGKFGYGEDWPDVTTDTPFDLASLTKVIATTSITNKLCQDSVIRLSTRVADVLPDFLDQRVTLEHLLRHESGLPAYLELTSEAPSPEDVRSRLILTRLEHAPEEVMVYSCLGFILLQFVLEACTGQTLDQLFVETVMEPMHWDKTCFHPTRKLDTAFPPTSTMEPWRKELATPKDREFVQGLVHDPLAFLLGGVSGNAGLFGSAYEIAGFCQSVLQDHEQTDWWTRRPGHERGLGWSLKSPEGSSAGNLMSCSSFGHNGFTGTSLWIDPEAGFFAVLLTNATHPNGGPSDLLSIRSLYGDLVYATLND